MIQNFAVIALTNIRHRKLRSFLTIVAIVIGIAAVISLISVSQGMQEAVAGQFNQMGADKITISPGAGFGQGMSIPGMGSAELTDDDLDVVVNVRGVKRAVAIFMQLSEIEYHDQKKFGYVIGIPTDIDKFLAEMQGFELSEGRDFQSSDTFSAIVGSRVSTVIFDDDVVLKTKISIAGHDFRVIGIMKTVGSATDDGSIIIPIETARDIFDAPDAITMIIVQVIPGFDPGDVAKDIEDELEDFRGTKDFSVSTTEQLMAQISSILGLIQMVLIGIAAISLLVGGIGIMNTMYTSVLERTREIGILKAIGARNSNIMVIFLLESGIIGLIGGIIGTLLGLGMAKAVEFVSAGMGFGLLKISASPMLILMGLGFAFIIGCISGVLPARRAAKLQPADALRYE